MALRYADGSIILLENIFSMRPNFTGVPITYTDASFNELVSEVQEIVVNELTGGTFSDVQYLAANPDVAEAVINGSFPSGLDHFVRIGQFENRSTIFDDALYLALNSDVATAVYAGTLESGAAHFVAFGRNEGRQTTLDEGLYLLRHPDVAAAIAVGAFENAREHYIAFGSAEGRALS